MLNLITRLVVSMGILAFASCAGVMNLKENAQIYFTDSEGNVQSSINKNTVPDLVTKMAALESRLSSYEGQIATLQAANNDKTILIQSLNAKLATLEEKGNSTEVSQLQSQVANLENWKDSIADSKSNGNTTIDHNLELLKATIASVYITVENASASSEYSTSKKAMNAFDEDEVTEWASKNENDAGYWIKADFAGTQCVSYFKFKNRATGFNTKEISLSFDGSQALQNFTLTDDSTHVDTLYLKPAVCTTFVKITANSYYDSYLFNGAASIHFYGLPPMIEFIPTGTVAYFPYSKVPVNFLECNGALVSRTKYAALFKVIGTDYGNGDGIKTFKLPDFRGEFIRGWDHGRGVDSNRTIGSAQAVNSDPRLTTATTDPTRYSSSTRTSLRSAQLTNPSEFRPRNVALMACIKY